MLSSSPPPFASRTENLLIVPVIAKSMASRTVLFPDPFLPFTTTNPLGRSKRTFPRNPRKPQSSTKSTFIPAPQEYGPPQRATLFHRARSAQHSARSSQCVSEGAPSDPPSPPPRGTGAAARAARRRAAPPSPLCQRPQSSACVPDSPRSSRVHASRLAKPRLPTERRSRHSRPCPPQPADAERIW